MDLQRQVAYKIWIADLISGKYIKTPGEWESNYVEAAGKKVSRVNLIGNLVDRFISEDGSYARLMLDDGSGIVAVKAWREAVAGLDFNVGDLVLVIGRVKEFNNLVFVTPEIVKKLENSAWARLRRAELIWMYGERSRIEMAAEFDEVSVDDHGGEADGVVNVVEEKVVDSSGFDILDKKEKILNYIERNDRGNGVSLDEVKREVSDNVDEVIEAMLKDGELYKFGEKLRLVG